METMQIVEDLNKNVKKFKHAKKEKIHIVNPAWLWVTYHNWKRHSESDFQVPETHENDLEGLTYSSLQNALKKSSINLNLKMLAQLSILDKTTFSYILQDIKVK